MARRTQAQLAQTRQDIIASATRCFAEKGFAQTQVAEIATGAGVGMSAFYGQFKGGKEALFLLIIRHMFDELHAGVLAVRRDLRIQSPLDTFLLTQRMYEMVFETLNRNRQITLSAFRSGFGSLPALETLYWDMCDAIAEQMTVELQRSTAAGLLKIARPTDLSDATFGMVHQLAHRMVAQGSPTPSQAARICTQFTLGAFLLNMPHPLLQHMLPLLAQLPDFSNDQPDAHHASPTR
jgi:AcrR family transcriptional regulator